MIRVYFESNNHAELVATFNSEELYIASLPMLKHEAKKSRMDITESIDESNLNLCIVLFDGLTDTERAIVIDKHYPCTGKKKKKKENLQVFCPICQKELITRGTMFCSEECRDIWFNKDI